MSDLRSQARPDSVLEDPGTLAVATMYAQSYMTAAAQARNCCSGRRTEFTC